MPSASTASSRPSPSSTAPLYPTGGSGAKEAPYAMASERYAPQAQDELDLYVSSLDCNDDTEWTILYRLATLYN